MTKQNRDINKDISPAEKANIAASVPVDEAKSFGGDVLPDLPETTAFDRGDVTDAPSEDEKTESENTTETETETPNADAQENGESDASDGDKTDVTEKKDEADPEGEEKPDGEKDPEQKPEGEGEGEEAKPKRKLSKAQERIQKEVKKRKAAEKELADLRAKNKGVKPVDEKPAEPFQAYTDEEFKVAADAQLDGDYAPMRELMSRSISNAVETATKTAVDQATHNARVEISTANTNAKLAVVADEIGESYPELNVKSDSANQDMIEETLGLRDFYANRGSSYPDALREAAETVAHKYGLGSDETSTDVTNPLAETGDKKVGKKKTDITAKIDLAGKEKGVLGGDGEKNRDLKPDLLQMSEEQFNKVSKEELARARGDIL